MTTQAEAAAGDPPDGRRRNFLYAGVGAAAAVAGAGLAWWNWQRGGAGPGPLADFWRLDFPTPDGSMLPMRSLRGRPVLLNFWATWCPPCVEELPLLDAFFMENSANGWQVLGLAVDQVQPVRSFLARAPVSFPVVMAGLGGVELSKGLGNSSGGLPFSIVVGEAGQVLESRMGRVTPDDLARWRMLR
jgi:thiol-disulfide isomerase/thioredoxin